MFTGDEIVARLEELGITHVIWVPDSSTGPWESALETSSRLKLIRVCREGEAWPLAAGLLLGGKSPLIIMQTTGLFESGDALRNVVFDLKSPVFALIGVRNGLAPQSRDSAKLFAEPIVRAWEIDTVCIRQSAEKELLANHYRACRSANRPGIALCRGTDVMPIHDKPSPGMDVIAALQVLMDSRKPDQMVVTNQGSSRIWPKLCQHPLDFHYNPSTMGGAIPLALGLALAQPQREVFVVSGDGALLMNLGSLVTVISAGAVNLTVIVLNNGLYEVTGGQQTPAAGSAINFAALALAAGFPTAVEFRNLSDWQTQAGRILNGPGPRFISLLVQPSPPGYLGFPTPPLAEQIARLRTALQDPPIR